MLDTLRVTIIDMFMGLDLRVWLSVLLIIIGAFILVRIGSAAITNIFQPKRENALAFGKRSQTMATLLKSILRYVVYFIAGTMILGLFGVQVGTLLAGAGLVGLAIGLGAKNLIQDILTGFFILFEDQYAVGEFISAAGVSGAVEEVGLRVTRLKDAGGQIHFIPNGQITQVTNFSRHSLTALVDIPVLYEENLDKAIEVLRQANVKAAAELEDLIAEAPEVLGVTALNPGRATIRISARAKPMLHWKLERELRKRAKDALEAAGIKPPQPGATEK